MPDWERPFIRPWSLTSTVTQAATIIKFPVNQIQSACHESSPQRSSESRFPSFKQRNADVDVSNISKFAFVVWKCQVRLGKMALPDNHSTKRDTSSLIHWQWVTHASAEEAGRGSLLFTSVHFDSFKHHNSPNSHFLSYQLFRSKIVQILPTHIVKRHYFCANLDIFFIVLSA